MKKKSTMTPPLRLVQSESLRDATGALPRPEDRQAVQGMSEAGPARARLYYPSTVRTKLVPGLVAPWPWHWVWIFRFSLRQEDALTRSGEWMSNLREVLNEHAGWAGLMELGPTELTFHAFIACRKGADPFKLRAGLLAAGLCFKITFSILDYNPNQGPAHYLKTVRYPCCRVGFTFTADDNFSPPDKAER
jgi:hypothetical protein